MRVLHVSASNLYGGLEIVLVTLARRRALNPALQCEFALCFAGRAKGELRVRWPLSWLRVRRALSRLIGRRGFDAVICHSPWSQAIFGRAVRAAGAASIFRLHDVARDAIGWNVGPPASLLRRLAGRATNTSATMSTPCPASRGHRRDIEVIRHRSDNSDRGWRTTHPLVRRIP